MANYDKITFQRLGKFRRAYNIKGKLRAFVMKCPICKAETTFYRRKGVLKIKCDRCPYEMITKISKWVGEIADYSRSIREFFINVLR